MQQLRAILASPVGFVIGFVAVALIAAWSYYSYVNSFSMATFQFNPAEGAVVLTSPDKTEYTPTASVPLKLKKGSYNIKHTGENVDSEERTIDINQNEQTVAITFTLSESYLTKLYEQQREDIAAAIVNAYPKINSDFVIAKTKLYGQGEWFGAVLLPRKSGDNADALRILLHKEGNDWKVYSKPPTQILSKQTYPDVPYEILKRINARI